MSSESEEVVLFLKKCLEKLFEGAEFDIVKVVKNFKSKERFELSLSSEGLNETVLESLGIIKKSEGSGLEISDIADKSFMKNEKTMLAFLVGAFLGAGSVSVPNIGSAKKSYGYHFEISVTTKNQADILAEILSQFDIFPKIVERGEQFVLYLKNSEAICDCLGLLGASKAVLELTSDKVTRDKSNNTNRQINCISANIDKAVNAGLKQLEAIETIRSTIGIESLPEGLAEACLSRLANPEGTLAELLDTLPSKISKGALAQRFKKIIKIAEELGEKDEK